MAKQNGGIMSPRGSITSDVRTNTLIVTDTEEKLPSIKEVVNEIDIPNDQVLIEAMIVEILRTSKLELGFNYGVSDPAGRVNLGLYTFNGGATPTPGPTPAPFIGTTAEFAYTLAGGVKLSMEIRALESKSLANEVASPHLVVTNNQVAFIKDGSDVLYNQATASGAAAVAFQEAVLELQVTPQIAPDGNIIMDILVIKNSVGASPGKTPDGGDLPPIIKKREITTKVMTKDGDTVVISGIYQKVQKEERNKIPLLGDIPYLGYLFSYTRIDDQDSELLIFITPKIIQSWFQK